MSEEADTSPCCAACGIAEGGDVKLKRCNACYLVRYCGTECQRQHRREHKKECKKRAAELRDELLFKQPESSHLGDCPICCLPLPLDKGEWSPYLCCSKLICHGCYHANMEREADEEVKFKCPFCRLPLPTSRETNSEEKLIQQHLKRVEANDPYALQLSGSTCYHEGDFDGAYKQWKKAADLGDADAHFKLSIMYREGHGVEKDEKKEWYHLEEASILGHPDARRQLAVNEGRKDRFERAAKHFIIAANLGHDESIQTLKEFYRGGAISNEDFAAALRAHKAAVDATKSPQREMGKVWEARAREQMSKQK